MMTSEEKGYVDVSPLRMRKPNARAKLVAKMDVVSLCDPVLALSDAKINTFSSPNVASLTAADKIINNKLDSAQVEGEFCLNMEI